MIWSISQVCPLWRELELHHGSRNFLPQGSLFPPAQSSPVPWADSLLCAPAVASSAGTIGVTADSTVPGFLLQHKRESAGNSARVHRVACVLAQNSSRAPRRELGLRGRLQAQAGSLRGQATLWPMQPACSGWAQRLGPWARPPLGQPESRYQHSEGGR